MHQVPCVCMPLRGSTLSCMIRTQILQAVLPLHDTPSATMRTWPKVTWVIM